MNILVITKSLDPSTGGWGRYAKSLVDALRQKEIESVVLCNGRFSGSQTQQVEGLPPSLSFKRTFLLSWLYACRFFFLVCKHAGKKEFHLIHCMAEPYAVISYLLSLFFCIPHIVTVHGSRGVLPFAHPIYGPIQKYVYKKSQVVICVSDYTKKQILRHVHLDNILVITNGVEEKMFIHNQTLNQRKENIILSVGGLKERKGYHHVLKALKDVKKEVPDIEYVIVGDQNDREYSEMLKNMVKDFELSSIVLFKANISDEELHELYGRAKVFVLTPESSDFGFEGFGLVFLEANAHGVPTIGAFGSGAEEAIINEQSGFLVDISKKGRLSQKIVSVLKMDDMVYRAYSGQAIELAKENLWSKKIHEYCQIYQKVIKAYN